MADEQAAAPSVTAAWNARLIFGSIGLGFAIAMNVYLTVWGKPENSLHASAQSWSFFLMIAILGGFGFGQLVEPLLNAFGPKKA